MSAAPILARLHGPLGAIVLLIVGLGALGSQDVVMKRLSTDYSVLQLLFIRTIFSLLIFQLVLWCIRHATPLDTYRLGMHMFRGALLCLALGCYYVGLSAMPLLDVVAIFFTAPLFATAASAWLLKERVGARRWIAIVAGFAGALLMIRPGGEGGIQVASLFAVGAAVLYAASIVVTRMLGATESAVTTAYLTMLMYIGVTAAGLVVIDGMTLGSGALSQVALVRPWGQLDVGELTVMCLSGGMVCLGFFCLAQAYRMAEISLLASWEYTSLLWGGLWGYIFFQEVPSALTLVGAVVIVASGLYVARR